MKRIEEVNFIANHGNPWSNIIRLMNKLKKIRLERSDTNESLSFSS